jgi:hypothetical protein
MSTVIKIALAFLLIVVLLAIGPWLVIWSLNTLFPSLAIEFGYLGCCCDPRNFLSSECIRKKERLRLILPERSANI